MRLFGEVPSSPTLLSLRNMGHAVLHPRKMKLEPRLLPRHSDRGTVFHVLVGVDLQKSR